MSATWNCGCSKWQHGTGDDACDQFLPEMKPALRGCPITAAWRAKQIYDGNTRLIQAMATAGAVRYNLLKWDDQTCYATMGKLIMKPAQPRKARRIFDGFWQGLMAGALAASGHRRRF